MTCQPYSEVIAVAQETQLHGPDRRTSRRYAIELEGEYVIRSRRKIVQSGKGRSCNISASGLLFRAGTTVPVGSSILVSLNWPLPSATGSPLMLVVAGSVVRRSGGYTAISIAKRAFVSEAQGRPMVLRKIAGGRRRDAGQTPENMSAAPLVLVVETIEMHEILSAVLGRHGYEVRHTDREGAIELLKPAATRMRILITDTLEGFEPFIGKVPVIHTTSQKAEPPGRAPDASVIVLQKPVVYRDLLSAVEKLCQRFKDSQESGYSGRRDLLR